MSASPTIIVKEYIRTDQLTGSYTNNMVLLKLEVRYKEFDTIIDSKWIDKTDKTMDDIKTEALMSVQSEIQQFVQECEMGGSIVGSVIPLPNNFI